MDRSLADHKLWQFKPFSVFVAADTFVGVEPFAAQGVEVTANDGGFTIQGTYGFDCFTDNRFVLRVDGQLRTYTCYDDIPSIIDNVVEFVPDDTHDITFHYRFARGADTLVHRHWVHHDTSPWIGRLQELVARETNGGWNASSDSHRRRRHTPLLRDEPRSGFAQRLLQWNSYFKAR